jgi:TPR repeat protein
MNGAALSVEQWRALLAGSPTSKAAAFGDAARSGDQLAALHFGQCLLDGHGIPADPKAAFGWFARAAGAGLAPAMNMVGRCLDQGWGVDQDWALAAQWFAAAAERGEVWGLYNYATALALGRGVEQDRAAALGRFRRAAAMPASGLAGAKSQNMIGSFFEDGWTVPANLHVAAYHYTRAAKGGDFRGCFNHARMELTHGRLEMAHHWLGEAARLSHERFRQQMVNWLAQRSEPILRALAGRLTDLVAV